MTYPPTFEFLVAAAHSGSRIDSFLTRQLRNYHPWRIQRIARAGGVTVNGVPADQTDRVFAGQCVRVRLFEPPDKLLEAADVSVPVLYRDPWLAVVDKPAGMIAHPVGDYAGATLANALQGLLDRVSPCRGLLRPGIVHRLDRQTSGLMAVALTHDAHVALSESFENSRVRKEYVALVEGRIAADRGTFDWRIGRAHTGRHVLMSCRPDAINSKPARTNYEVIERFAKHTLVRALPRTGRNHQIRVHFAHAGHPLVGDEFYRAGGEFHPLRPGRDAGDDDEEADSSAIDTGLPIRRHALHAARLELAHPITAAWLDFSSSLPRDFEATLVVLRTMTGRGLPTIV